MITDAPLQVSVAPGVVYKFFFQQDYQSLEGIYLLTKIMTYDAYLQSGGDLTVDFYPHAGKDDTDLTLDLSSIRAGRVFQLDNPNASDIPPIFAPECYLSGVPDHNVRQYHKIGMISFVGIVDEIDVLDYVVKNIEEEIQAATGIVPKPEIIALDRGVWMTDNDYAEEVKKRDETLKKTINFFSENKRLQAEINQLRTRLTAYEEIISARGG